MQSPARASLVDRPFRSLFAALFLVFTLFGATVTVIGAALPRILAEFGWSYGAAGLVMAMGSVGNFAISWLVGRFIGRIGARAALLSGLGLCALGLASFALLPSVALNAGLYFIVGAGQGFLETGVNWSVLRMGREGSSRAMSLMHGAFALGAVLAPLAAGAFLASGGGVGLLYRGAALLCLLMGLALILLPMERLGRDDASGPAAEAGPQGAPEGRGMLAGLGAFALFLYVGAEIGLSNWCAEFFVRALGATEALGALAVSLFWAGLLAGRFGLPLAFPRARLERQLVVLCLGFAASLALLWLCALPGASAPILLPTASFLAFVAGLAASGIYPFVISLLGAANPRSPGPAIGFAATGGGIGAFFFPFAMSGIASAWGIHAGFGFYALTAAAAAAAAIALARAFLRRRP
jgi:fucose permease